MYDIRWSNADYWSLYEGATAHLKAAITIDGIERMVDMGSYKVYEVETVHEVTTLTCYDAMKAADVTLCKLYAPPSETNFGGALLSGTQSACTAACAAFREKVKQVAQQPIS